jgi:serine O-acetyltransferase
MALPFLYFKGFQALQSYRASHWLWNQDRKPLALYLQSRISEAFDVDIHPAARIGKGILIDHGTGVVIGETAVVGDNVSMLHEVTLGGTGKESGDRHPKVGHGVLIGAGAKILGNIRIGDGSKIAAGSIVLDEVPAHTTVAGIPAKPVGRPKSVEPALLMDQSVEHDYSI